MLLDLIDRIYEAALAAELWPSVLEQIKALFGATCSTIVPFARPAATLVSSGGEQALAAYADHWWQFDVIAQTAMERGTSGLACNFDGVSPDVMAAHPFYQEFRRSFDMGFCLALVPGRAAPTTFAVSTHLPFRTKEPPDGVMRHTFATVAKHVSRAYGTMCRLTAVHTVERVLLDVLSALPYGAALLGAEAKVLLTNAPLDAMAADGLCVIEGRLRAPESPQQRALDRLVHGTVAHGPTGDMIALRRPSGRRPFLLSVIPLGGERTLASLGTAFTACRGLMVVVDSETEFEKRTEGRLVACGLSPAEARLCALIGTGKSPKAVAEILGITENTARTTLKHCFDKLAIARQSELSFLVGRLASLPAG